MANWVLKGLRTGIKTDRLSPSARRRAGVSPGRPLDASLDSADRRRRAWSSDVRRKAIAPHDGGVAIDQGRCIHCFRCRHDADGAAVPWDAATNGPPIAGDDAAALRKLEQGFRPLAAHPLRRCRRLRRLHERGAAAQQSLLQHASPRLFHHADAAQRRRPAWSRPGLRRDAASVAQDLRGDAEPKRVVAIGACAIFGGVFGPSFAAAGGAAEIIPVDVVVPGCPPPPLAILHGLLLVVERKPPATLVSAAPEPVTEHGMSTTAQLFGAFFILCAPEPSLPFWFRRDGARLLLAAIGSLAAHPDLAGKRPAS